VGTSGLELGFQYRIIRKLLLGIHVLNPYKTALKTYYGVYRYPSRINFGASYRLSDYFSLTTQLDNDFNRQLILRTGLEYIILDRLVLRTGISGMPYHLSVGIGFQVNRLIMDLATNYSQYLGNSPSVSFNYLF